jgi:hypothetical protein
MYFYFPVTFFLCLCPEVCKRKKDIKVGTPKSYEIISIKKSVCLDE